MPVYKVVQDLKKKYFYVLLKSFYEDQNLTVFLDTILHVNCEMSHVLIRNF